MERKHYLRGLGLGIVVTAIIMSVTLAGSRTMTNDEIIARAKELGMVENTVLSNTGDADGLQASEADSRAGTRDAADQTQDDLAAAGSVIDTASEVGDAAAQEDGDAADVAEGEAAPEVNDAGQMDTEDEENSEPENTEGEEVQDNTAYSAEDDTGVENVSETVTPATVKVITINNGDGSYTVAKKLADAGIVASAQDFDTYLCQNGYDKRLRTGNFSISTDASDEQIARIITGME